MSSIICLQNSGSGMVLLQSNVSVNIYLQTNEEIEEFLDSIQEFSYLYLEGFKDGNSVYFKEAYMNIRLVNSARTKEYQSYVNQVYIMGTNCMINLNNPRSWSTLSLGFSGTDTSYSFDLYGIK